VKSQQLLPYKCTLNPTEELVYVAVCVAHWKKIDLHRLEQAAIHKHVGIRKDIAILIVSRSVVQLQPQSGWKLVAR
jgi:hypothetical protein